MSSWEKQRISSCKKYERWSINNSWKKKKKNDEKKENDKVKREILRMIFIAFSLFLTSALLVPSSSFLVFSFLLFLFLIYFFCAFIEALLKFNSAVLSRNIWVKEKSNELIKLKQPNWKKMNMKTIATTTTTRTKTKKKVKMMMTMTTMRKVSGVFILP